MQTHELHRGRTPLLVSIPHCGTDVPASIRAGLTPQASDLPDTDWHVHRLYDFARALGASVLSARYSRYVIDLNRDPEGKPLYPGASNTELVPSTTFDDAPVHREGREPSREDITRRVNDYWRPYHDALARELQSIREREGIAVLFDAHSIRSVVPRFFQGRLPDFNLGTADGASAHHDLSAVASGVLMGASDYSTVVDGRFKGGYITRRYGHPEGNVHALQLELSQRTYMDESPPYDYRPELADSVQPVLQRLLKTLIEWAQARQ